MHDSTYDARFRMPEFASSGSAESPRKVLDEIEKIAVSICRRERDLIGRLPADVNAGCHLPCASIRVPGSRGYSTKNIVFFSGTPRCPPEPFRLRSPLLQPLYGLVYQPSVVTVNRRGAVSMATIPVGYDQTRSTRYSDYDHTTLASAR